MDWFTDIPRIFLAILLVIGGTIAIIFFYSIDYANPDKFDENLEKTTDFLLIMLCQPRLIGFLG